MGLVGGRGDLASLSCCNTIVEALENIENADDDIQYTGFVKAYDKCDQCFVTHRM